MSEWIPKFDRFSESWLRAVLALVLFMTLYKVILTFESVDEILNCDQSNESYWSVLSRGTVYYAVQGGSNFRVCAGMDETRQYQSGSRPVDKRWGRSSKPWDKRGGGGSLKKPFSALRASVWSKNKGGLPLDPPMSTFRWHCSLLCCTRCFQLLPESADESVRGTQRQFSGKYLFGRRFEI